MRTIDLTVLPPQTDRARLRSKLQDLVKECLETDLENLDVAKFKVLYALLQADDAAELARLKLEASLPQTPVQKFASPEKVREWVCLFLGKEYVE